MSRPKGSLNKVKKENTKDVCLYVRCTQEEKNKLQELASSKGVSLSKYILECCFR